MSRIIIIGGIESTYTNAQVLFEEGEEIVMFFTRGPSSPGWEGVDMIDESNFSFAAHVPKTVVNNNINDHVESIQALKPDYIWSLGWQQIFKKKLLSICPVIGIHESLLPKGAGPVPIANAILNDEEHTGVSLFWVDEGMDTGPLIDQRTCRFDPRRATSTEIYQEMMLLEKDLIRSNIPKLRSCSAPRIQQDLSQRTTYSKITWEDWPEEKVARARTYPYT